MFTYKTLIRDKLVDDAGFKALFAAAATGSCRVFMDNLIMPANYPQVIISYGGGVTRSNLDADNGQLFLTIEARGTIVASTSGTGHALREIGEFRSEILSIIDDTAHVSTTAVCYFCKKFSEFGGFDEERKIHFHRIGFDTEFKQNFNFA